MLTPTVEITMFLSATFLLGLVLGWVLWYLSAKQEISSINSERDFWKKSYDQARLQGESNQEFGPARATTQPRTRHSRSRVTGTS
ncbi:MAG: hypothetical protein ABJI00_13110 [Paracoccaceae bacterium]